MLCSDILRFADPRLENKVRVNEQFDQGKTKFVRISEEFELSGVNYYKKTVSDPTGIGFSSS
jgi:hypothetical protein